MLPVREELHQIIDHFPDDDVDKALEYPRWHMPESDKRCLLEQRNAYLKTVAERGTDRSDR